MGMVGGIGASSNQKNNSFWKGETPISCKDYLFQKDSDLRYFPSSSNDFGDEHKNSKTH